MKVGGDIVCNTPADQLESLVRLRSKPLEEQAETQKKLIARLEKDLELNEHQMRAALEAAGEAEVPPEQIAARLVEIAGRYKALREEVRPAPGDDPHIAELKAQAAEAIEQGELERADAILAELAKAQEAIFEAQKASFERAALDRAETQARRGGVALARLRYGEAAGHFAQAAGLVPGSHEEVRAEYLERQAAALYRQGDEKGDNAALIEAIVLYRELLKARSRERVPLDWAMTQNNLGTALASLGERESGTEKLEQAVEAYRAALLEWTRERVPLDWARTQMNLGNALARLGERESGTEKLEQAVEAYRAALLERTRERVPLQWALTQMNLGNALARLGERQGRRMRSAGSISTG
jgi:tetratricopeptide (TPR) repeat protein